MILPLDQYYTCLSRENIEGHCQQEKNEGEDASSLSAMGQLRFWAGAFSLCVARRSSTKEIFMKSVCLFSHRPPVFG